MPPLEAMVLGAPTVASNRGSLPETAGPGAAIVDPDDQDGWVEAVAAALGDPGPWRERAKRHAAHWTWSRAAQSLLELWSAAAPR